MCHQNSSDFIIRDEPHISLELIKKLTEVAKNSKTIYLIGQGEPLMHPDIYEIIKNAQLSYDNEKKLYQYIRSKKIIFISTPFCKKAVDRLMSFNVPAFKIGSGECNNYPLVEYIAKKRKPIILSTGMNSLNSISKSVKIMQKYKVQFALLHCTNLYPTPNHLVRLNAISEMKKNESGYERECHQADHERHERTGLVACFQVIQIH
jgi:sialic acid synthase SpsE